MGMEFHILKYVPVETTIGANEMGQAFAHGSAAEQANFFKAVTKEFVAWGHEPSQMQLFSIADVITNLFDQTERNNIKTWLGDLLDFINERGG